jgi:hypothetical protein
MINLQLEVQEVEAVLNHLAKGLFADVANLIAKIRTQAIPQVQPAEQPAGQPADPVQNPEADAPVVEPSQH